MANFIMEKLEDDVLWIIFENCESISIPEGWVTSLQLSGIKKTKSWHKDCGWKEFTFVEGVHLSLFLPKINPDQVARLKRYQDITSIHFQGEEYIIEYEGDYDNLKQKTMCYHETLVVSVCDDNLEIED